MSRRSTNVNTRIVVPEKPLSQMACHRFFNLSKCNLMKNKELRFLIVGGLLAYVLLKRQRPQQTYPYHNYPQIPQAPPDRGQAFQNWVTAIVGAYGTVSQLWQPGGPFYRLPSEDIFDVLEQSSNNPYTPGGNPWEWG